MTEPNWKEIAMQLAQRVNFAVSHLTGKGVGLMMNMNTGEARHWREYMADGLEMIPGVKVDREMMHTFDLPAAKRKKAQNELLKRREVEK